jgi:hypothetical protein
MKLSMCSLSCLTEVKDSSHRDADSIIRVRCRNRCSVFVERTKPSSSVRSVAVKIAVASGRPLIHP